MAKTPEAHAQLLRRRRERRAGGADPDPSRRVPIIDRTLTRMMPKVAAWQTVEAITKRPVTEQRRLTTVIAIRAAVERGVPVVLSAPLPVSATNTGELVGRARPQTVVLASWATGRKAFRIVNSCGVGWGQMGRAWLPSADLQAALARGRAWAPVLA